MKNHSVKLALRTLSKQKAFTLISILGLATSLAVAILVISYFFFEISFDKHIPESQRTYRIITRLGTGNFWSRTFAAIPDALEDHTSVEDKTSFLYHQNSIIQIGREEFTVSESVSADSLFMDFFNVELISGSEEDLIHPDQVFITEEMAGIFFPGQDPLGKEIFLKHLGGTNTVSLGYFTIAGLVRPLPDQTHFGFQLIFSQKGNFAPMMNHLKENKVYGAHVYVRLFPGTGPQELEAELSNLLLPFLESRQGPPVEAFNSVLQPIRDIHFTPDIHREPRPVTRRSMIYLLLSVGFLILVLMTINFLTAVLVQHRQQQKARSIMRILGADGLQLYRLSMVKIACIVGAGLFLSWILIAASEPYLKDIFGADWSFRSLGMKIIPLGLAAGILVVFFTSGSMQLSLNGYRKLRVFGPLMVIQFVIVIILLCFSSQIQRQIRYMDQKDLGYSAENLFVVRIPSQSPRGSLLVEEIRKHAGVVSASTAHHHPSDMYMSMSFKTDNLEYPFSFRMVDENSIQTLDVNLMERFGAPESKMAGWIVNETFYHDLLQNFTPEEIATSNFYSGDEESTDSRSSFQICGVMENLHYSSLHQGIGNFAFLIRPPEERYNRWLLVRYADGQSEKVLRALRNMMDMHFQGKVFEHFILEDQLDEQYAASRNLSKVIRAFSVLSVLIAISGLYGLSLFINRKRRREIGIRKIHGAETGQIIRMLNLGMLRWVGVALIFACPIALWALNKWLMNFAFKTVLSWWIFPLSGIFVGLIALIAVSMHTRSAARLNPVESIRI